VGSLAAIRPDDESLPLFLHVAGAMLLVGGLLAATSALSFARGSAGLLRLGYYTLLVVAVPGWFLMFAGAEWIYRKQGFADEPIESAWILVGFLVAEVGGVLLLAAVILGGVGVRRLGSGRGASLLKTALIISIFLLVGNTVTVWAMAGKPG
jgi:uncharacterized membrane-anchored protein